METDGGPCNAVFHLHDKVEETGYYPTYGRDTLLMGNDVDNFAKLVGLSVFLGQQANLDDSLDELVAKTADILDVSNCSIMLFKEMDGAEDLRLMIFAKYGYLPPPAMNEAAGMNDGIAGHVAATGEKLLVEDIKDSPFFQLARRPDAQDKSFISVPIMIGSKPIGVINFSNAKDGRSLTDQDLNLASLAALILGNSIHVNKLQNLLKSRFAQLAMVRESEQLVQSDIGPIIQAPSQLVKVLAKSFYREMVKIGLGKDHIISTATEIISLLSESLERHRKRIERP